MDCVALLGAEPEETGRPTTVEEVAETVARADASGKSVIPWGGGTAQDYGYPPRRADLLLDLSGLNRILAHEPGDLTVTVQAGATLAQVQQTLAAHHQFLPLDPPDAERATLGGILATNAWGPSRLGHGTARDWLIGLTAVDARGRIVKGGGKVVKNVTGYDLPKLHIGALGTLGVIVEATFKVAPRPEASETLGFQLPPTARGQEFAARLHAELSPAASLLLDRALPEAGSLGRNLFARFDGPEEVVASAVAAANQIADACGAVGMKTAAAAELLTFSHAAATPLIVRFSGSAGSAYGQHEAVALLPHWEWVRTLPGTGHTDAALSTDADAGAAAARVLSWARERETPVSLLKAPPPVRQDHDVWWPLPPGFALMRRMKETLDPNGTLNPGRFIGRL